MEDIHELRRSGNAISKEEKQNFLCVSVKIGLGNTEEKMLGPSSAGVDWLSPVMLGSCGRILSASTLHPTPPEHLLGLGFRPLSLCHHHHFLAACYIRVPVINKRLYRDLPK